MQRKQVYSNVCRHINDKNIERLHSKQNSVSLYLTTCWRSVIVLTACNNNCICAENFHSAVQTFSLVLAVPSFAVTMSVDLWTALSHLPDYLSHTPLNNAVTLQLYCCEKLHNRWEWNLQVSDVGSCDTLHTDGSRNYPGYLQQQQKIN